MANYSDHTRKDQVFNYLRIRINSWVDGPDISNEQVGGSEGLKRLRELRKDLVDSRFEIEMRSHPDPARDIFQYRMVERPRPPEEHTEVAPAPPMQVANDPPERTPTVNPVKRTGSPGPAFQGAKGHLVFDPDSETYLAVYDGEPVGMDEIETPVPGQSDMGVPTEDGLKYTVKPEKIDFGSSRPCPKCHGIHRAITEQEPIPGSKKTRAVKVTNPQTGKLVNKVIGYESWTRNPSKPSEECPRCNGFGLIPA